MFYDPDADHDLASLLGAVVNEYWNQFLEHWELQNLPDVPTYTEEERGQFQKLSEVGEALRTCMHSLTVEPMALSKIREFVEDAGATGQHSDAVIAGLARRLVDHRVVRDSIGIQLGFEATDTLLKCAETRAETLITLIGTEKISERAALFLDRATRLYLWGFDPECVIMSAAVLEAALASTISPEQMRHLGMKMRGPDYSAAQYASAALASGLFTDDDAESAKELRLARNDAVHNAPALAVESEAKLRILVRLLKKLFPLQGDSQDS